MADPFHLERFLNAQEPLIDDVRLELHAGIKQGHWMWFIFPQLKGLGRSPAAERFAISSKAEAQAYLDHQTLGSRLIECTDLVNAIEGRSAVEIFGHVDSLKFRSSMTLFSALASRCDSFARALQNFYDGQPDQLTLDLL